MPKSRKKFLTAVVSLIFICLFIFGAYAWFAGIQSIGSVNFRPTANANLPELDMWMYYSANDFSNENETEGWVEQTVTGDNANLEFLVIPDVDSETIHTEVTEEEGGESIEKTYYSFTMSSMHFGKIDNLVTLSNDNRILLRFYFDKNMLNNSDGVVHEVIFSLSYKTSGYNYDESRTSIFDSIHLLKEIDSNNSTEVNLKKPANQDKLDSGTATEAIYVIEYREDKPAAMQFLQMRYAISNDLYEPGENGFVLVEKSTEKVTSATTEVSSESNSETVTEAHEPQLGDELDLSHFVPVNCGSGGDNKSDGTPICADCAAGSCGKATITDDLSEILNASGKGYNIGDGFYVYIELAPLLDAFGMQENILDYFVPAYMFFDVVFSVEIG